MTEGSDLMNAPPNVTRGNRPWSAGSTPHGGTGKVCAKGIVPFRRTLVGSSPLRSNGSRWKTFIAK